MKNFQKTCVMILLILFASAGCATTKDINSAVSSTVSTMTSNVDENLYAGVPDDKRGEALKAEFDLKVSEDEQDLAELKRDLAALKKKYSEYDLDIAKKNQRQAELSLKLAKLEAIERSGLGNKENNIKALADLESKKLRIEADKVKVIAKLTTTDLKIEGLAERVRELEQYISANKSEGPAIQGNTEAVDAQVETEAANPNAVGLEQ